MIITTQIFSIAIFLSLVSLQLYSNELRGVVINKIWNIKTESKLDLLAIAHTFLTMFSNKVKVLTVSIIISQSNCFEVVCTTQSVVLTERHQYL